jgi:nicotinate-nucleotide--dimethylbenzimidazole phosphoribosyltransferase
MYGRYASPIFHARLRQRLLRAASPSVIATLLVAGLFAGVIISLPEANAPSAPAKVAAAPNPLAEASAASNDCEKQAWPYIDQRCAAPEAKEAEQSTRQVRVVSTDRNAAPLIVTAAPASQPQRAVPPVPPRPAVAQVQPPQPVAVPTAAGPANQNDVVPIAASAQLAPEPPAQLQNVALAPAAQPAAQPATAALIPEAAAAEAPAVAAPPKATAKFVKKPAKQERRVQTANQRSPANIVPPGVVDAVRSASARDAGREQGGQAVPADVIAAVEADARRGRVASRRMAPQRIAEGDEMVIVNSPGMSVRRVFVVPREASDF